MYIQAHVMSGWVAGNYLKLTARERFFCMLAAGIPDIDGLGILVSQEAYYDYHHILGHNLLFGVIMSLILAVFSSHKIKCFIIYLALFHLHILMDLLGSGECWTIAYFQPFSSYELSNGMSWALYSWQNMLVNALLLFWTIAIIINRQRSPLEYIMPSLDKKWSREIKCFFSKFRKTGMK